MIVNKIWARNGSVAVVPESLTGCFGSGEFPMFAPIRDQLEPRWINWLTKTRGFWVQCDEKSQGTSGKNRIRPERFLEIEIPLPPLAEQRRIVARIEELAVKIEEARTLRQQATEEADALLTSTRRLLIGQDLTEKWIPLHRFVAAIENGKSPQCEPRPASPDEWGVLKVGAVSFGTFDERENKAVPRGTAFDPRFEVKTGDFLMTRANTTELVGACTIVRYTRPKLLLSDKTFRFHFHFDADVDPRWLDHAIKSPALREQIARGASGTSPTMKNISKEKVLALLLPMHSLPDQRRIVAELDALEAKVDELKRVHAETAAELDALLPSILDKSFKGEL